MYCLNAVIVEDNIEFGVIEINLKITINIYWGLGSINFDSLTFK